MLDVLAKSLIPVPGSAMAPDRAAAAGNPDMAEQVVKRG
jgi:hypothetical protein